MPPARRQSSDQLSLPLADPRLVTTLARLDDARELVGAMLDGHEMPRQLSLVSEPVRVTPADMPPFIEPADHRLVFRRGRARKGGERSGVRLRRRMTVYFDPELAEDLEAYALLAQRDMSDVIGEAVERLLDRAEAAE